MWNTRYCCWHYYQPSYALSSLSYTLYIAENLMNGTNSGETKTPSALFFVQLTCFFFSLKLVQCTVHTQRQIVTWFLFKHLNVTWNWKCRCWIPFFFISFVHCWVFIVGNSFFSFGISIPFKEQFNKRILWTVEFFHLENFLKTKRKSFDWNVVIVRCAWDHKSSVLKHPVQQVMSHSVWQSITTV